MNVDTVLINFYCPTRIKKEFDRVCSYKYTTKTHVLNDLIEQFVDRYSGDVPDDFMKVERPQKSRWTLR